MAAKGTRLSYMIGRLWEALSLPVTIFIILLTFSLFSIWLHSSLHEDFWEEHAEQDLRRVQQSFSDEFGNLCRHLHALAAQIEQDRRPRADLRLRLEQLLVEHPFLSDLTWVDRAALADHAPSAVKPGADAWPQAGLEPFSFDLIHGESDFKIHVPVDTSDGIRGELVACVPMREVLDHSIAPDINDNYFIALSWNRDQRYLGNSRALQPRRQVKKGALAHPLLDLNVSLLSHQLSRIQLERVPLIALSLFLALGLASATYGLEKRWKTSQASRFTALRQAETRYRHLFERAFNGICIFSARSGRIIDCNPAFEKITGRSRSDLAGQSFGTLWTDPVRIEPTADLSDSQAATGTEQRVLLTTTSHPGVPPLDVEISLGRFEVGRRPLMLAMVRDVSHQKQLAREAIKGQRLQAIEHISLSICHNFNNILTSILGPTLFARNLTQDEQILAELDQISLSAQRASDLIAKLYASVHEVKFAQPVPVKVLDAFQSALLLVTPELESVRRKAGTNIAIECALSETDEVLATETLLQTIFQKLLQNSIEALPNGGNIIAISRPAGRYTEIEITDDGIGLDEAMQERVFEPLVTTKAQIGKGLSLAFIRSTVLSWKGTVNLSSIPKVGTTVSLRIPSALSKNRA